MKYRSPGQFRKLEDFRARLREIDADLDCDVEVRADGPLARSVALGERTIGNRFAIHPMEGWDGTEDGGGSELTLRRWRRFGNSGAKLIWGGEAFAVRRDGRANPRQLFWNDDTDVRTVLTRLIDEVVAGHRDIGQQRDDLCIGLQLTHSGRFARPEGPPAPRIVYRHPVLDARAGVEDDGAVLSDGELEAIGERFVGLAEHARAVGFDFVDVKCCHGYLLHELLGAKTRPGPYGGSFANRTRFLRNVIAGIRATCPDLEIGVRASMADTVPYAAGDDGVGEPCHEPLSDYGFGVDSEEQLGPFAALLDELGVRLVNVTLGSPYYCPHLQRPAAYPPSDGYQPPRDPLYEVATHIRTTREVKRLLPDAIVVGTGYSYLQEWLPNVAQYEVGNGHVDIVGIGRMVLAYPELPRDVLAGKPLDKKRLCRTLSDCTTAPRNGLVSGCFPLDPHYAELPEAETLACIKKQRRRNG